ncbi:YciI family protein [Nocardioides currus]|uniref:Transcription initiation protein n=1 Tax=Nocardioides currus TaxID=2133958 RepID=A0A2R7YS09_9ACTN|nr:YciI family protein [Nocardioides currus]PUA79141.1 transcription initiation protein [Nocardioides currus]
MTEYIVLIVGDADRWWTTMSMQERADGYAEYERFGQALAEGGHKVTGGAELKPSTTARTVRPDTLEITDGPYAESAEQVGGFYQVETDDLDGLLECCKIIAGLGDAVQVVPTVSPEERP